MTKEIDGIVADRTCDACPTQYEGEIDGNPFYFRARWGWWTLTVVRPGENPVCPADPINKLVYQAEREIDESDGSGFNGYMDHQSVMVELERARDTVRSEKINSSERTKP